MGRKGLCNCREDRLLEVPLSIEAETEAALASVGQWVGTSSHTSKGCRFNSRLGHLPRFWVCSLVGVHVEGN